jgi:hypothetical protein
MPPPPHSVHIVAFVPPSAAIAAMHSDPGSLDRPGNTAWEARRRCGRRCRQWLLHAGRAARVAPVPLEQHVHQPGVRCVSCAAPLHRCRPATPPPPSR